MSAVGPSFSTLATTTNTFCIIIIPGCSTSSSSSTRCRHCEKPSSQGHQMQISPTLFPLGTQTAFSCGESWRRRSSLTSWCRAAAAVSKTTIARLFSQLSTRPSKWQGQLICEMCRAHCVWHTKMAFFKPSNISSFSSATRPTLNLINFHVVLHSPNSISTT